MTEPTPISRDARIRMRREAVISDALKKASTALKNVDTSEVVAEFWICQMCGSLNLANIRQPDEGGQPGSKLVEAPPDKPVCDACEQMAYRYPEIVRWVNLVIGHHIFSGHEMDDKGRPIA